MGKLPMDFYYYKYCVCALCYAELRLPPLPFEITICDFKCAEHLHLVDGRYGIILTVDIEVENPLVEDYGAFGTHRWQSSLCTLR